MLTEDQIAVLTVLMREAGVEAALRADKMLDEPSAERPKSVAEAIAIYGRDREGVKQLAKGLELPSWLGAELKERAGQNTDGDRQMDAAL